MKYIRGIIPAILLRVVTMFKKFVIYTALLGLPIGASRSNSAEKNASTDITVRHDADSFVSTVMIPSDRGRVQWVDVMRGLARSKGFDDSALDGVFPNGSFDATSPTFLLQMAVYNALLRPNISFDIQRDGDIQNPSLIIKLDREALLASNRRMKNLIRDKLLRVVSDDERQERKRKYGLKYDDGWQTKSRDKNLVVLIHGLNSHSAEPDPLLSGARKADLPCATFDYPNDQSITKSAGLLAKSLNELRQKHPDREVTLLTHSMGGLVARAVIKDKDLDPGNVNQLIMVAPPNHGSVLAHFAYGLDIWEYVCTTKRKDEARRFYAAIEDGFAEATTDLRPNSPFLRRLNSRPRNDRVAYTIILGTNAPLEEDELSSMREQMNRIGKQSRWVRFFGARLDPWLADMEEVADGKGDGVVAVRRGQLEGVTDEVIMTFSHSDVFREPVEPDLVGVHDAVLSRLLKAFGQ